MSKRTKEELENRITEIRASRVSLGIFLVLEAVVVLMHFPEFLGMKWLESVLIFLRNLLVNFLWPKNDAEMVTYKGTVYEICTWFQNLPIYDLLVQVIIYLVPVLFVLTFVRIRVLERSIKLLDAPEKFDAAAFLNRTRGNKVKATSGLQPAKATDWWLQPAFSADEIKDANEYCDLHRQRCEDAFADDPGLRIQRIGGELSMSECRDYVKPWDEQGEIDLQAVFHRPFKVKLERGRPYIYYKNEYGQVVRHNIPLNSFTPMAINARQGDEDIVAYIITWLGG